MSANEALRRNYSMYSCRYGNLYTTAQLLQLIERAYGRFTPQLDHWNRPEDGRFVDPFRPRIEPDGFATLDEMRADRERHLAAVRHMLETMDVFVFTFGHTETWRHKPDGAILQLAPGVAGGDWDPSVYEFYNMTVSEVVRDFLAAVDRIREVNPKVRIVLSVSPVGIIATYEDRHVDRIELRGQGDPARRRRRGGARTAQHRLFPILRSRHSVPQCPDVLSRGHAPHQSLWRRSRDEGLLRPLHRSPTRASKQSRR